MVWFFFSEHFLTLWHHKIFYCYILLVPVLAPTISPRSSLSFCWRMVWDTKSVCLVCSWSVTASRPSVWTLAHLRTHIINTCTCYHQQLYYTKNEFILMSPTVIRYCADQSSLFPLLISNLSFQEWEVCVLLLTIIHFMFQFQYPYIVIIKFLTYNPMGNNIN